MGALVEDIWWHVAAPLLIGLNIYGGTRLGLACAAGMAAQLIARAGERR